MKTFTPADMLLPADGLEYMKWAVVACDQYTSDMNYWNKTENLVGDAPSTLRTTLQEIYLGKEDTEKRIEAINKNIENYLNTGKFKTVVNGFVYVERTITDGSVRKGLIGKLDLEDYSFIQSDKTLIRATEETVLDRIPPRVEIRKNAAVEFPHIMVLIDDPLKTVIEPLSDKTGDFAPLYDFDLMNNSGHIKGWLVRNDAAEQTGTALGKLASKSVFNKKYGFKNRKPLVFAMGDGNHSLATAKTCWENIKKTLTEDEAKNHPARYALAEIVNIHDESLKFEPIHRVLFNADYNKIIAAMSGYFTDIKISGKPDKDNSRQHITMIVKGKKQYISIGDKKSNLAVGSLQGFIDRYLSKEKSYVDYIHDDEAVIDLCDNSDNIGFLLPPMGKDELFKTIVLDGVLPRKTFSMGHADDKRFYLEGRKIK